MAIRVLLVYKLYCYGKDYDCMVEARKVMVLFDMAHCLQYQHSRPLVECLRKYAVKRGRTFTTEEVPELPGFVIRIGTLEIHVRLK